MCEGPAASRAANTRVMGSDKRVAHPRQNIYGLVSVASQRLSEGIWLRLLHGRRIFHSLVATRVESHIHVQSARTVAVARRAAAQLSQKKKKKHLR